MFYECVCTVIENTWGTGHWQYTKFCSADVLAGTIDGYMISDCAGIEEYTYESWDCPCVTR